MSETEFEDPFRQALADAWDEGYSAGWDEHATDYPGNPGVHSNPYRSAP